MASLKRKLEFMDSENKRLKSDVSSKICWNITINVANLLTVGA